MNCGPDPCARSPALGGELSLHKPPWLSLHCPGRSGTGVPGEAPGCLSALPPSLLALPRDPQPHAEAGHGDQCRLPAPAHCKHRGPQHTWASRCSSTPPGASHLPRHQSPTQPQCTSWQDGGSAGTRRAMTTRGRKGCAGELEHLPCFPTAMSPTYWVSPAWQLGPGSRHGLVAHHNLLLGPSPPSTLGQCPASALSFQHGAAGMGMGWGQDGTG